MINRECIYYDRVGDIEGCSKLNQVFECYNECKDCAYYKIENNIDKNILTILKNEPNYTSVLLSNEQCKRIVEMLGEK